MEQYIEKAAVVAEIKKLKGKISDASSYCNGWQHALRMLELSLDTLEVKEIDLEKEIEEHVVGMPMSEFTHESEVDNHWDWARKEFRHFFELGLNASNPLTWEDMMLIHKCIKDAMNYHLYKMMEGMEGQKVVYQEVLKRFKAQKGE